MECTAPLKTITNKRLTPQEELFIDNYITTGNATQAVKAAGYKTKAAYKYGSALLRRDGVALEIQARMKKIEDAKICSATEVLQFYSSVMRGEILDQFGLEASLDTRIKSANELAKHLIEIPQKLEQKNITNNIGSISLNFLPRKEEEIIDV
jgi:phage terminase small subunit